MFIAIVDDSQEDRLLLSGYLSRYGEENSLQFKINPFKNGIEFLTAFTPGAYSIIFLDIFMDGIGGMETAEKIREQDTDCLIIFSTSSDRHAVKSYRVRAFDYLVKPYSYGQLCEVLRLCGETVMKKSRYIQVKESRVMVRIALRDILYVDYYKHYVQFHTKYRVVRSYMPFSQISEKLLPYAQFVCCYRNLIVNMDEVELLEDRCFVMKNGDSIPIARTLWVSLRQQYADYALEKLERGG